MVPGLTIILVAAALGAGGMAVIVSTAGGSGVAGPVGATCLSRSETVAVWAARIAGGTASTETCGQC